MVSPTLRESIRALYDFRCGYCGVTETESGGELSAHIESLPDGRLIGLTKRGWFHIQRLRLNRAQLIELRLQRVEEQRLRETLEHNQRANARLREYVRELEQETERLLQIIAELTGE